jgi:hypothetical protein
MDNFDRLVQFIDRYTDNGTEELPQVFGEGVGAEAVGVTCLSQFLDRDWGQLQGDWQTQSDLWIEALIYLLVRVDNPNSQDLLVQIVLLGSDEASLTAIEHVWDFREQLNPEVRSQLDRKISRIISSRVKRI